MAVCSPVSVGHCSMWRSQPPLLSVSERDQLQQVALTRSERLWADKTWKVLEDAIHEINNHNASGLSFEELYRCVATTLYTTLAA